MSDIAFYLFDGIYVDEFDEAGDVDANEQARFSTLGRQRSGKAGQREQNRALF